MDTTQTRPEPVALRDGKVAFGHGYVSVDGRLVGAMTDEQWMAFQRMFAPPAPSSPSVLPGEPLEPPVTAAVVEQLIAQYDERCREIREKFEAKIEMARDGIRSDIAARLKPADVEEGKRYREEDTGPNEWWFIKNGVVRFHAVGGDERDSGGYPTLAKFRAAIASGELVPVEEAPKAETPVKTRGQEIAEKYVDDTKGQDGWILLGSLGGEGVFVEVPKLGKPEAARHLKKTIASIVDSALSEQPATAGEPYDIRDDIDRINQRLSSSADVSHIAEYFMQRAYAAGLARRPLKDSNA